MECRDARPLIENLQTLADRDRRRLERHLFECAACRDEVEDPIASFLAGVSLPLAIPPPDFTPKLVSRLPAASPIAIAQHRSHLRRIYWTVASLLVGLLAVAAVSGYALLQISTLRAADRIPILVLPLALAAKAILNAAGEAPIATMGIVIALVTPLLLRLASARRPWAGAAGLPVLAGVTLAALLLVNGLAVRRNISAIREAIDVQGPVAGNVTSIAGDITIHGDVGGDVVALAGTVALKPGALVHGSVMSGAGQIRQSRSQVVQAVITQPVPVVPLEVIGRPAGQITLPAIERIIGLLAALVTLMLGALLVVAWPQGPAEAAAYLRRFPGRALVLGLLATLGLVVLALGGTILLAATVGGVLLVPVLLVVLHLPYVTGVAAIGQMLGVRLAGRPSVMSSLWGVATQIVVIIALGLFVPAAGMIVFYLLGSIGLGGALLVPRCRAEAEVEEV